MLPFDAFVEECAGVCFACSLFDRRDVVECFMKMSWLMVCSFVVSGRQAEAAKPKIHRHVVCE